VNLVVIVFESDYPVVGQGSLFLYTEHCLEDVALR